MSESMDIDYEHETDTHKYMCIGKNCHDNFPSNPHPIIQIDSGVMTTLTTYASIVKDSLSKPCALSQNRAETLSHNSNGKRNSKNTRKDSNKKARTDEPKREKPVTSKVKNQETQTSKNSSIASKSRSKSDKEERCKKPPISQDDHLEQQIKQVCKEKSKGYFKLLADSVSSSNGSTLQSYNRSSNELEETNNSNVVTNQGVPQPVINPDDNNPIPQTANVVKSAESNPPSLNKSNVAKTSMGDDFSQNSPPAIFSKLRKTSKKKKHKYNTRSCKPDDKPMVNDIVQDDINRNNKENCSNQMETRSKEINIDETTNKNSKRCKCLPSPKLLNLGGLDHIETCYCDVEVSKDFDFDFDFDKYLSEEIPDKTKPMKVTKNKQNKIEPIHGYESVGNDESDNNLFDQAKSDRKVTNNSKHQKNAESSSIFHLHLPNLSNLSNLPKWALNFFFFKQPDPPAPKESTSTSNPYSNSRTCGNSHSTNYETYGKPSISNSADSYINFYNNNNKQDNVNQCNSLLTASSTQHMVPHFSQKSIHLLVLVIAFEHCYLEPPLNIGTCHSRGYHPIIRMFRSFRIDGDDAFDFIYNCIMNCWANSWKIALVVSNHPTCETRELHPFFRKIRKLFESDILDIILIRPTAGYYNSILNDFDVSVAKDSHNEYWNQVFHKLIQNAISKAYRRNKYDEDDILFYNKDEPYYEFTNFYRAPIKINYEIWPTTEHYFQAAKFHDRSIRNRIRYAYSAREAFTIARSNDYRKRKDWESPIPPDGTIFKEGIMKHALWEKFTQHDILRNKLLSTGKVKIYEHTENDRYWGDGGTNRDGLNKLGIMLKEIRDIIMEGVKSKLISEYPPYHQSGKWVVPELKELQQFEDLIKF